MGIGVMTYFTFRYPVLYYKEISANSKKYGLDQETVCSLIWTESKFDKNAKSNRGAVGLMQLMPSTAEWCCQMTGQTFDYEKLTDPGFNIELGCYYFAYLLNKFQNISLALAAYNAGEGNVSKWIASDGIIQFEETRNYIDTVNRVRPIYRKKLSKYEKTA